MKDIKTLRKKINNIDHQIIKILTKRQNIVKKIFLIKNRAGLSIVDTQREKELKSLHTKWSLQNSLEINMVKKIFHVIFMQSRKSQYLLHQNHKSQHKKQK